MARFGTMAGLSAALLANAASLGAQPETAPARPSDAVVVPPKLLSEPQVPYPEGATGSATVVLALVVDASGAVRSATPGDVHEPFSSHAAAAAETWRFEPAKRGGLPVAAKIRIQVLFTEPASEPESIGETPQALDAAATRVPAAKAPPEAEAPMEITVLGDRAEPSRRLRLTRAEVREIPGTFGDPFRAIETMPGVTPIVSGLPFFFIRGAPPGNAGYFLDGLRVPLLFHVGAGPSVVHPAVIERVDLYPGGYPARYGRFAGGIIAGETATPRAELGGEYNLRLFDAGVLVEAPFADGRGNALAAGRYSYTALLLSAFSPETTLDYWDYQGRVSYGLSARDRVALFAFGSYDFVGQKAATENLTLFGTEFHRLEARYDRALGGRSSFRSAVAVGLDRSQLQRDRFVTDHLAAARSELVYELSPRVRLRAGTDLALDRYAVELGVSDLSPALDSVAQEFTSRTDVTAGARTDLVVSILPGLEVTPGVRADVFGSDGVVAWAIDPRLGVRAALRPGLDLLVALGIAHQPPSFVVPVPGFQPGGLVGGLQRAIQESLGVELDLGNGTTASATVFQNAFFDMSDPLGVTEPELSGCPPGSYPTDSLGGDFGGQWEDYTPYCGERFEPGTAGPDRSGGGGQGADSRRGRSIAEAIEVRTLGSSYGLELFLKRRLTGKLGGFLAYTLSRSTRSYERKSYVAAFDRTHVINAALAYDLGRRWRAGTRVMFYTGLPKARDPSDPEATRLPPFFRLDVRLEKRWQLGRKSWIAFVAEWMNATLAKEAVTTRCTLAGCEAQTIGPVTIPSLGVEGGF